MCEDKKRKATEISGKPGGNGDGGDNDGNDREKKKAREMTAAEKRAHVIGHLIRLIYQLLDIRLALPQVPMLADLASERLADMLPEAMGDTPKDKRAWQFASVGVLPPTAPALYVNGQQGCMTVSGGMGTVTFASNDMRNLKANLVDANTTGNITKMTDAPGAKERRKKIGGKVFHTETRQLFEGCTHISVTGGLNCIFCALYRRYRGLSWEYHRGSIASWYCPQPLTVAQLFGATIALYVSSAEFTAAFGAVATAQGLVDILTSNTRFWDSD